MPEMRQGDGSAHRQENRQAILGLLRLSRMQRHRQRISQLVSRLENDAALPAKLYAKTGRAHIVGITGPPGVGKSSLIDRLIEEYRRQKKKVGVIAVDPTSPITGGALLGDRLRMQRHSEA